MHCRKPQLASQPRSAPPQPPRWQRTPACQSRAARNQRVGRRHRPNGFKPPGQRLGRGSRKSCACSGSRTTDCGRRPGHHGVGVRSAHAERARPCGEGPRPPSQAASPGRSRGALARHRGATLQTAPPWSESRRHMRVQGAAVGEPWPRAVVESHCSHQQAGQPCCPLRVTVAGLHGKEARRHISVPRGRLRAPQRLHERPNLDGVSKGSSGAVQSHVAHVSGPEPRVLQSGSQQYSLLGAVRCRQPAGAPILVDGRRHQHGQGPVVACSSPCPGGTRLLRQDLAVPIRPARLPAQHDSGCPLAPPVPVTAAVQGPAPAGPRERLQGAKH